MSCRPTALLLLALGLAPASAHAQTMSRVTLEDPADDDTGDGALTYPSGNEFKPGDFDLRKVELVLEKRDVVIRVTLGAPPVRPPMVRRSMATEIQLENGLFVQNIDLYIDRDPGQGSSRAIPGRNVAVDLDHGWDVAVILTPQPFLARDAIESALPEVASRIVVPAGVRAVGNTIIARVSLDQLGGPPQAWWGYAVAVSGASWEISFDLMDRVLGSYRPNVFTMPVLGISETYAFGGGQISPYQPRVADILTPAGKDQRAVLSDWQSANQRYAALPMVYPRPDAARRKQEEIARARPTIEQADLVVRSSTPSPARPLELRALAPAAPPAPPEPPKPPSAPAPLRVTDVQDNRVVLAAPEGTNMNLWRLGLVIDEAGNVVARVVITAVYPGFVLATTVEGQGQIRPGAQVRFDDRP